VPSVCAQRHRKGKETDDLDALDSGTALGARAFREDAFEFGVRKHNPNHVRHMPGRRKKRLGRR
jgi:hypothetical protein